MTALERTLYEARSAPPLTRPKVRPTRRERVSLSHEDYANLRAVRDAWNAYRAERGLAPLSIESVLQIGLATAAGWLAGKDGT